MAVNLRIKMYFGEAGLVHVMGHFKFAISVQDPQNRLYALADGGDIGSGG